MACRRKTNAVSHSPVRTPPITPAPAFFARLWHDGLSVANILRCRPHLAPCVSAALHCGLERSRGQLVHINHILFHTKLRSLALTCSGYFHTVLQIAVYLNVSAFDDFAAKGFDKGWQEARKFSGH